MEILLSEIKKNKLLEYMPFSTQSQAISGIDTRSAMHPLATSYVTRGVIKSVLVDNDYTCKPYELLLINTANNPVSIHLPLHNHIQNGDYVEIFDVNRNAKNNNIEINGNGSYINHEFIKYIIDMDGYYVRLVYNNHNYSFIDNIYYAGGIGKGRLEHVNIITNMYELQPNIFALVDTSSNAVTLTLPHKDKMNYGDVIEVFDYKRNAENNNITIDRNNNTIEGVNQNIIIDVNGYGLKLVYIDDTFFIYDHSYE